MPTNTVTKSDPVEDFRFSVAFAIDKLPPQPSHFASTNATEFLTLDSKNTRFRGEEE